eukprot:GDKH01006082.1.p1 GENE.GDKH01006082.1~~GDKH01006082.1.p1  ORF type:complete len:359 (+),score=29.80 GDKH01006082.1:181-1257(+)
MVLGLLFRSTAWPQHASIFSRASAVVRPTARGFSSLYSPLRKRNVPAYIDFETHFPKKELTPPTIRGAFTMAKQKKMLQLISDTQTKFRGRVVKPLTALHIKHAGRSKAGEIRIRHRHGGTRQLLRFIDFKRARRDIFATVLRIEHDPTRTAYSALIQYEDGVLSYIIAPHAMRPGDRVLASANASIAPGNCLPLRALPIGTLVHNVELRPGAGGEIARAAGTYATILSKDTEYAVVRLLSTEIRKFSLDCWATVGQVSNPEHCNRRLGKAGANFWRGFRPSVRGNAMVPSRHPHGGGTSAKHNKMNPRTIWGVQQFGISMRYKHKPKDHLVRMRLRGYEITTMRGTKKGRNGVKRGR